MTRRDHGDALLSGALARDAEEALRALSEALLRRRTAARRDPTLANGEVGVALAHVALDRVFHGAGHAEKAQQSLVSAVRALAVRPMGPGLFEGISGVAWVSEILAGSTEADPNLDVDAALDAQLDETPWEGPFDLAHGLVGVGVYALERLHRPSARRIVERVIEHLAAMRVVGSHGITWPSTSPAATRPDGGCDLGVAHGVPGVVALLGRAHEAGIRRDLTRDLLDGAIDWILAHELAAEAPSRFARTVEPARLPEPARLAWCYGDAGVAASLLVGATALGERARIADAIRIGHCAARRDAATSGVVDTTLCHGAIGLAHIFHRLHRATGDEAFAAASRAWFERGLSMRDADPRYGGFHHVERAPSGALATGASWGFLTGSSGVALALAAALDARGDAGVWDRALLLSGGNTHRF